MTQNLFVGNLSYETTEEKLRTLFDEFGQTESVRLVSDRYTGRSRGFAFVEMSTEQAAEEAISEMNNKQLDGREIKVEKAKPRPDRDRGPRW